MKSFYRRHHRFEREAAVWRARMESGRRTADGLGGWWIVRRRLPARVNSRFREEWRIKQGSSDKNKKLLYLSHSTFFLLGVTGNVYTVTLSIFPSCSCPNPVTPYKHILFVLIRVLRVSLDNVRVLQSSLFLPKLHCLLQLPTSPDALADAALRQRFHQLFFSRNRQRCSDNVVVEVENGTSCLICLGEMKKEDQIQKLVACGTCQNAIHKQCFLRWKGSKVNNRVIRCVICRAPWNNNEDYDQHRYLNLSAYTLQRNHHQHLNLFDLDDLT
ncbi:uncharacterized protein LOC129316629 [Prosopis cineraria]|uniref:uncharacterized protein LOC129297974 n=1 Tax=Prosopis cineraria TaxID=364024 RepID=UPI0024104ACB|nr:uncharacterized protein LOC129297974 [Prosopis cineraria]XP_054817013.1 uncharacterized protein LOC129316629 [Prosopis cineraria]